MFYYYYYQNNILKMEMGKRVFYINLKDKRLNNVMERKAIYFCGW